MHNPHIAAVFDEIADLLEFQGANPFRVRAYRNGARIIRDLTEPLAAIVADSTRSLTEIDGIGKDLADKISTLVQTGQLPLHTELQAKVPPTVLALLRIPGLGPKKAAVLHKELGIASLDALQAACEAGQVRKLKGFGEKTEKSILHGISMASTLGQRMLWAESHQIVLAIRAHFEQCASIAELEVAGSYRRGRETVGDLDVLVVSANVQEVMDCFDHFPDKADVLGRGETKMSIRTHRGVQVDLRVVPPESFGAALQYFTGSKDHNVVLRGMARQRGLKINEYGVFDVRGKQEVYLAGRTEEEVYAALDLPWFPPEMREARREFEWAKAGPLPRLVELRQIRGDLHMHTTDTDGKASLEEMVEAAQQRGLQYIAITDHSKRVTMARGLDPKRLRAQWKRIDALNKRLEGAFVVLKGIECDVLEKGGMDLPDDVLAEAEWVLASVHYGQNQPRELITERMLGALENPYVTAIAHPTGRLLNRREAYQLDLDAVFAAAKRHRKILEINASPRRLDLNDVLAATAKALGIPIVINTDAHSPGGMGDMQYGVLQARRAGLTADDVVNTRTVEQLKKFLSRG